MAERHIIISTDSRFRRLEDYLHHNNIPGSTTTTEKVLPGGSLLSCYHSFKSSVHDILSSRRPDLLISQTLAAGICDFTRKPANELQKHPILSLNCLDSAIDDFDLISSVSLYELRNWFLHHSICQPDFSIVTFNSVVRHREPFVNDDVLMDQQQ